MTSGFFRHLDRKGRAAARSFLSVRKILPKSAERRLTALLSLIILGLEIVKVRKKECKMRETI